MNMKTTLIAVLFAIVSTLTSAQSSCTFKVPVKICEAASTQLSSWPEALTKNLSIVIADPVSFADEDKRLTDSAEIRFKSAKTTAQFNRASGRAILGISKDVLLETSESGSTLRKLVISTDFLRGVELVVDKDGKVVFDNKGSVTVRDTEPTQSTVSKKWCELLFS